MKVHSSEKTRANLELHAIQAQFYEITTPQIFNLFGQRKLRKKLESLSVSIPKGGLALDLGSGTGNIANHLRRLGWKVVAADVSKEMLKKNPADSAIACDAHFLPLREGKFAIVATYSFFHHVDSPDTVLREILRVAGQKCVLYFGADPFLASAKDRSPIHWLATHPKEAIGWILWLAISPKRLATLLAYLLFHRRRYVRESARLRGAEDVDVLLAEPAGVFVQVVQDAGFRLVELEAGEMVFVRGD
jgi:SAM-dependent methyltransferase